MSASKEISEEMRISLENTLRFTQLLNTEQESAEILIERIKTKSETFEQRLGQQSDKIITVATHRSHLLGE